MTRSTQEELILTATHIQPGQPHIVVLSRRLGLGFIKRLFDQGSSGASEARTQSTDLTLARATLVRAPLVQTVVP